MRECKAHGMDITTLYDTFQCIIVCARIELLALVNSLNVYQVDVYPLPNVPGVTWTEPSIPPSLSVLYGQYICITLTVQYKKSKSKPHHQTYKYIMGTMVQHLVQWEGLISTLGIRQ